MKLTRTTAAAKGLPYFTERSADLALVARNIQ